MGQILVLSVLLIAIVLAVLRGWNPRAPRTEGRAVRRLSMPWPARVEAQRVPLAMLIVTFLLNLIFDWVEFWIPLLPLLGLGVGLLFPAEYVLTDRGVQIGKTAFRRWTEFSGVAVRRGRLQFKHLPGVSELHIWLPGQFDDAEVVAEVRRLMRAAYTGATHTPSGQGNAPCAETDSPASGNLAMVS
jgi:hypothetical protein